ncbi:uncharacterized protein J7T54_004195 [Emericellopsis cladophorae]|uniref:Uncharacterized protein n=1 Tax=Emericellopsis cladophorae TaxID=2686198 RepID=A0A9P9XTX1_9HYPO|nr:uncharacterized protein J7T54_004195 [Emericellopsis cladophorae]KAI6777685.1 hypothetical protein J7T54_004195 [Emericellopsis cladophorae]
MRAKASSRVDNEEDLSRRRDDQKFERSRCARRPALAGTRASSNTREHDPSAKSPASPFTTVVLTGSNGSTDALPASYHSYGSCGRRAVANPAGSVPAFIESELSLGRLGEMDRHLWFASTKRPATQLHWQVALGWPGGNLACRDACTHESPPVPCRRDPRAVALGFLYTYACLLSSESDFHVANEKLLLPRDASDVTITWGEWKTLASELLGTHDPSQVHPRFLRAELRLSRINTIHRFTRLPPFAPYLRGWRNHGSLFGDNLAYLSWLLQKAPPSGTPTGDITRSLFTWFPNYGDTMALDAGRYTIAWIAPLPMEARAAVCLLDRKHSWAFPIQRGDDYVVQAGEICGHNVVTSCH